MRSEQEVCGVIERQADTVRRLCLLHLRNEADSEDIFQNVFLKYALRDAPFESPEHERAWFIRVTINACRDLLRSFFHSRTLPLEAAGELPDPATPADRELLAAVLSLPERQRRVVYLHDYEGYTAPEIGALLGQKTSTVYTLLGRARRRLKQELGGGPDE